MTRRKTVKSFNTLHTVIYSTILVACAWAGAVPLTTFVAQKQYIGGYKAVPLGVPRYFVELGI